MYLKFLNKNTISLRRIVISLLLTGVPMAHANPNAYPLAAIGPYYQDSEFGYGPVSRLDDANAYWDQCWKAADALNLVSFGSSTVTGELSKFALVATCEHGGQAWRYEYVHHFGAKRGYRSQRPVALISIPRLRVSLLLHSSESVASILNKGKRGSVIQSQNLDYAQTDVDYELAGKVLGALKDTQDRLHFAVAKGELLQEWILTISR